MALLCLIVGAVVFAAHGAWRGRPGNTIVPALVGPATFAGTAWGLYYFKMHRSLGLLGPLAVGLGVGLVLGITLWVLIRRRRRKLPPPTLLNRCVAGVVGAVQGVGFVLLAILLAAMIQNKVRPDLAAAPLSERGLSARVLFAEAAGLISRGVLSHLPGAEHYGRSLEDLGTVLTASPECQALAGEKLGFDELLQLPATQVFFRDREALDAIDDLWEGRLDAIYRLQANPRLYELIEDPDFQSAVRRLTLGEIARAIREVQATQQQGRDGPSSRTSGAVQHPRTSD